MNSAPYCIVIDDDPWMAALVGAATKLETISFASGQAFIDGAEGLAPQAVFIDVHLGVGDSGLDLIPTAKSLWPYCPVLIVTSEQSGDLVAGALAAGADDYVRKPINAGELASRLKARSLALLERQRRDFVTYADITLDLRLDELRGPAGTVSLSRSDSRCLLHLIESNGSFIERAVLKRALWGHVKVTDNALDRRLHEVRAALKSVKSEVRIKASYGKGLKVEGPEAQEKAAG